MLDRLAPPAFVRAATTTLMGISLLRRRSRMQAPSRREMVRGMLPGWLGMSGLMVGAWLGATLSLQMGTLVLRRLYAAFLLLLSIKMFFPN